MSAAAAFAAVDVLLYLVVKGNILVVLINNIIRNKNITTNVTQSSFQTSYSLLIRKNIKNLECFWIVIIATANKNTLNFDDLSSM